MRKLVEIHLAGQESYQLTVDGTTIRVHAGSRPGGEAGVPSAEIKDTEAESTADDDGHLQEVTDLDAPLYARRFIEETHPPEGEQ